jgi:hypothetical protein
MFGIFDADNIFDVVRPIHRYSRVFGLTAFGIDENKGRAWNAKTSVWGVLHVFLLSISFTIMVVCIVKNFDLIMETEKFVFSETIKISAILATVVYSFSSLAIAFVTLMTKHSIVNAINIIGDVDRRLLHLGYGLNHKKHRKFIIFGIIAWTLFTFASSIVAVLTTSDKLNFELIPIVYICMIINVNFLFAFNFQTILIQWCLKLRFRELNRFFCASFARSVLNNSECIHQITLNNLSEAACLHELIVLASECASSGFGVAVSL